MSRPKAKPAPVENGEVATIYNQLNPASRQKLRQAMGLSDVGLGRVLHLSPEKQARWAELAKAELTVTGS